MEDRSKTLYWELHDLENKYNGVMFTFLSLKDGEHEDIYRTTVQVIKMVKYDREEMALVETLQGCEFMQHSIDEMKVIMRIMKSAINKAKNEHAKFDAELAKKIEAQAKLIHRPGNVSLWCDGELTIKGKMIDPPLPGLKGGRFVFPLKTEKNTCVCSTEIDLLMKLRAQMKLVIQ
jgi:hypothetical protein